MICKAQWPAYDEAKTISATAQIAVQVAGKLKANVLVPADSDDDAAVAAAMADGKIQKLAEGKTLVKSIVVRDKQKQLKLVNLILK
jgi:leucyl-tRNA synthetase